MKVAIVDRSAFMRWIESGDLLTNDAGHCHVTDSPGLSDAIAIVEADDSSETPTDAVIVLTVRGLPFSTFTCSSDGWTETLK